MTAPDYTALCARLDEVSLEKQQEAWSRPDGGADLSIGAMLAAEAAAAICELEARAERAEAERDQLVTAKTNWNIRANDAEAKLAEVEKERDEWIAAYRSCAKDTLELTRRAEALTARVEAMRGAGLRFTGLHPTPFGDIVGIEGYPPETMMLVSVCGASGIKPVRFILWHQLYTKDLPSLEAQGEVVICAVPYGTKHFSLTAALTTENDNG